MNKQKIFKYLGITFLITWTAFLIRAILCNINVITAYSLFGILLYGIGVLGPTVSAYMCLDDRSPKGFIKMLFNHKKGTVKYIIVLSILYLLSFYVSTFELKNDYPIYLAPVVFAVMLLFAGCNEEVGWYGTLYPELEKKFKAPLATLISLVIWTTWHLPMFITHGDLHNGMSFMSFFLFLLTMVLMKTALIRRTESVFYCGAIHAVCNVAEAMIAYEVNTVMTIATIALWVLSVILWYYPKNDDENNDNKEKIDDKKEEESPITPIINPELNNTPAIDIPKDKEVEELI